MQGVLFRKFSSLGDKKYGGAPSTKVFLGGGNVPKSTHHEENGHI